MLREMLETPGSLAGSYSREAQQLLNITPRPPQYGTARVGLVRNSVQPRIAHKNANGRGSGDEPRPLG
jgi:hypothetical protein